jgi:Uma2 family endonuclease
LRPAAKAVGLHAQGKLNVRLGLNRIANPDFVVTGDLERGAAVIDATDVTMVGEILSETTAVVDRGLKMQLYAEARIDWYLLVEPDLADYVAVTLRLFRLDGDHYVEHSIARHSETLRADRPFPFEISTVDLLEE